MNLKLNISKISLYPPPIRIFIFSTILIFSWFILEPPIHWLVSLWIKNSAEANQRANILMLFLIYAEFIVLLAAWGRWVYGQTKPLKQYGLELSRRIGVELLVGLGIGLISLFTLFITQAFLGWVTLQPPSSNFLKVLSEGLLVALIVSFAEELFFRGWILNELQRDYGSNVAFWATSILFSALHFIESFKGILRHIPQFPGLVLLGMLLIWARRAGQGRLGFPIGLHAGLVWGYYVLKVGNIRVYTHRVPEWITGFNQNPLSGIIGVIFLGSLAWFIRSLAQKKMLSKY